MTYSYYDKGRIAQISIRENLRFAQHKIQKLYPLHIVTTLAMFVLIFLGDNVTQNVGYDFIKLMLNVLMIQEYFPLNGVSAINAVAWYLCVTVLFYFLFPWLLRVMEQNYSNRKAYGMIFLSLFAMVLVGVAASHLPNVNYDTGDGTIYFWEHGFTEWFVYKYPIYRMLDIWIGCNLAYLFLHRKKENVSVEKATLWEIIAILLLVAGLIICSNTPMVSETIEEIKIYRPQYWWKKGLVWIPGSMALVYSFAIGRGLLSKLMVNKISLYIARISPYAFLIHYVVLHYLGVVEHHIPWIADGEAFYTQYHTVLCVTVGAALTVAACEVWKWVEAKVIKK